MNDIPKACVIGWPARHSRSPLIHRHWLRRYGIAGDYVIEEIEPEDFEAFLSDLSAHGYVGCNVTLPHKEAAARLVARRDETAARLGAVNTVWYQDGDLVGANTDVYGFLANLDAGAPRWDAGLDRAVVLGAGGAARGIVHGLLTRGVGRIDVVNRSLDRAAALADAFGPAVIARGWDEIDTVLEDARLLVNTTSLGMQGNPPLEIDLAPLAAEAIVNDIVYVPLETNLLKAARARDLNAVDGLGMLLYQAVPGFEKWFGVRPDVTSDLRAVLVKDIEGT
ncbi:shikimate dehydrogenase [Microbaculum marinisediminis]|uniref:Shikimate dehydrogenase (NADP(+)) n=1 Tax=Microbaculum marinisediminis TaxID=2931392 RepID=A0AAW5QZ31_9HYPH|nr:shikimate dehydrogenase [Microbaculum sp. A6E488]MCT8972207.1 shikimate dehydrogenase [Microbaculum sp. A6E488]